MLTEIADVGSPPTAPDRTVFWTYGGQWSVRCGDLKLVHQAREGMDPEVTVVQGLYDLSADPAETTDVCAERADELGDLSAELARFVEQHREWTTPDRGPVV